MATKKSSASIWQIKGTTYDKLKIAATIIIPAISALYATLAGIWGWDFGEQIEQSIAAVISFINVILGLYIAKSSKEYHKGDAPTTKKRTK